MHIYDMVVIPLSCFTIQEFESAQHSFFIMVFTTIHADLEQNDEVSQLFLQVTELGGSFIFANG